MACTGQLVGAWCHQKACGSLAIHSIGNAFLFHGVGKIFETFFRKRRLFFQEELTDLRHTAYLSIGLGFRDL